METAKIEEYRIAAIFRRPCWYVCLGCITAYLIIHWAFNRLDYHENDGAWMFLMLAVLSLLPIHWRLRIDQHGVSRRLLFWWDLWLWNDLASGRIQKIYPYTLKDPKRAWWNRTLRLSFMEPQDNQNVMTAINKHYKLPPAPVVPDELVLKSRFGQDITFSREGITVKMRKASKCYPWSKVLSIRIIRMDAIRRDFKSLEIELPDQQLEFQYFSQQGGTSTSWTDATAEEINEYVFIHADQNVIKVLTVYALKTDRVSLQQKLEKAEKSQRSIPAALLVLILLMVVTFLMFFYSDGLFPALVMVGVLGFPILLVGHTYRDLRKYVEDLKNQLKAIDEKESDS